MSRVENKPRFNGSKRVFKLRRYINVDDEMMQRVGLDYREWKICSNIEYWCEHEATGFVAISRAELGALLGLSADRTKYIVRDLVNRKFLKLTKNYHLAVTKKWLKIMDANGSPIPADFEESSTETPKVSKKPKETPKEAPKEEKQEKNKEFPFFEDEFGEDEKSMVDRPSLNQVRKKAMNIHKKKKITKELALEIATSFWRKKESQRWAKTSNFYSALKIYMDAWIKYADLYPEKFPEREKRIVTPTNVEEMRLFLKQMRDEEREALRIETKNKGMIVINGLNGMPVLEEGGEYLSVSEYENFMTYLLGNFRDGKLWFEGRGNE